jgi:hypothetical protein
MIGKNLPKNRMKYELLVWKVRVSMIFLLPAETNDNMVGLKLTSDRDENL